MAADEVMRRAKEPYPGIRNFSGDAGYRGTAARYADEELGVTLHISEKAKDFEALASSAENVVRIAMVKITLTNCV